MYLGVAALTKNVYLSENMSSIDTFSRTQFGCKMGGNDLLIMKAIAVLNRLSPFRDVSALCMYVCCVCSSAGTPEWKLDEKYLCCIWRFVIVLGMLVLIIYSQTGGSQTS